VLVNAILSQARSSPSQTCFPSILRRISRPSVHACRIPCLFGQGRCFLCTGKTLFICARGCAVSRRCADCSLRRIDSIGSREFEVAFLLFRFAPECVWLVIATSLRHLSLD